MSTVNVNWQYVAFGALAFSAALFWRAEDREDDTLRTLTKTQGDLVLVQRGLLARMDRFDDDHIEIRRDLRDAIMRFDGIEARKHK